ncbi:MAG: metallophosphoesterase family protein [Chloroflexi bacterium]|nr:metallophosphoesterase family protein [Chloroflexota bacterium]
MKQPRLFLLAALAVAMLAGLTWASTTAGQTPTTSPTPTVAPTLTVGPTTKPTGKGRVGQLPDYPTQYPQKQVTGLVLMTDPTVTVTGTQAIVSFTTVMPCPAASAYYGIYQPDQVPPLPRYVLTVQETLTQTSTSHRLTLDLSKLVPYDPALKDGGVVAYRVEVYVPQQAASVFFARRFAFANGQKVPAIVEGPFVDQVTTTDAVISWDTDAPARGVAYVGTRPVPAGDAPATHFEVAVTGLRPGQVYPYRVEISDGTRTASTPEFSFRTPARDARAFAFAVLGDGRGGVTEAGHALGGVNHQTIEQLMLDALHRDAAFVVHTGDLVNGYTTSVPDFKLQLTAYKNAIEPVAHYIPVYEAMGNHEAVTDLYDDGSHYGIEFDKAGDDSAEAIFAATFVNPANGPEPAVSGAPPYRENAYYFNYGNSRLVVMNNNYWYSTDPEEYGGNLEGYVLDDQTAWLKQVFAGAAADPYIQHVFLFTHEPPFPNGAYDSTSMWYNGGDPAQNDGIDRTYVVQRRDEVLRAFVETGKAVGVFCSHEHSYNRLLISSVLVPDLARPAWQVISGGAGATFTAQNTTVPWAAHVRAYSTQRHYCLIQVDGARVTLEVYGITGDLIDEAVLAE